jgi:anti-anti-sigma regulatory factor
MKMTIQNPGHGDITVLRLEGDLDAASFEEVIEKGRVLYGEGTRALLIDMTGVGYMGSSGLVALHSVALIMRGQEPPDPELGWGAFKSLKTDVEVGNQTNLKLLGPQPSVQRALERTGMTEFLEVHTDEQAALDSF